MQGQSSHQLMLVQSGSIKLTQISPNGCEVILRIHGAGEPVFLPTDYLTSSYSYSARAIESCTTLVWQFKNFQYLLQKFPQIRMNVNQILFNRLTEMQERFREVATEKVAQRLACALLRLAKDVGRPAHGGLEVPLNREELAQLTGTTLFTISRLLSKWSAKKIVLPRREAVVVLDTERLKRLSEMED